MCQMFSGTFSLCPLFEGSFPLLLSGVFYAVCCGAGRSLWKGRVGAGMAAGRTPPLSLRRAVGTVTLTHALARASSLPPSARTARWCLWPQRSPCLCRDRQVQGDTPPHPSSPPPPTPTLHITSPPCSPQPCQPPWRRDRVSCWPERALQTPGPLNSSLTGLDCPPGVCVCVCVVLGYPFPSKLCLMTPPTTRTLGSGQLAGGAVSIQCEWGAGGWGTLGMCGTFRVTSHIPQLFLCFGQLPSWGPCLRLLGKGRGGRSQEGAWPGV